MADLPGGIYGYARDVFGGIGWPELMILLVAALAWGIWYLPEFLDRGRAGVRLQQLVFDLAWERRDWAAMALAVAESFTRQFASPSLAQLVALGILVVVLLFKPSGLFRPTVEVSER